MVSCRVSLPISFRLMAVWLCAICAWPALAGTAEEVDPWERMNRGIYRFNDTLDRYTLKPVAKGYQWVTPDPVERGVNNMFRNLQEIRNLLNQLLQGKPVMAASDTARFLVNTTVGVVGIFDVASHMGLERHEEDFDQTLAVWGVPQGPYFVMPFFGPKTVRGVAGLSVDAFVHPLEEVDHIPTRNVSVATDYVSRRAELLKVEDVIFGDPYVFMRDAYLQQREALIRDGEVEDDFGSGFDETF
ncbi:MAG: VacJ family lipoprotein [Gammaproteobacteria bacterium]|nr:MAG: VacJ family lipoprotein [Gammaproteobacteria bacterium]